MCVQASNSLMIWSKYKPWLMIARTTWSGVMPGTRMSAAQPSRCCEVSLLPTESLTCLDRKAEFTIIGLPSSLAFTNSRNCASRVRFANSAAFGVLSNCRWLVIVNSASVKCGVIFYSANLSWLGSRRCCRNNKQLSPSRLCQVIPTSSVWQGCWSQFC